MNATIDIDNVDYDKILFAFYATNSSTKTTCNLIQSFFKALRYKSSTIFRSGESLKVAEIACGPGERTIQYFKDIDFYSGFDIRATDLNVTFTGENGFNFLSPSNDAKTAATAELNNHGNNLGLTTRTFLEAISSQTIPIKTFSITRGNIFGDSLLDLLDYEKIGMQSLKNTFPVAIACHCLYYIFDQKDPESIYRRFLRSITTDILAKDGIAIFCHSALKPNTFITLEHKFTMRNIENCENPTDEEYQKYSCDAIIENYCRDNNLTCYRVDYRTSCKFTRSFFDHEDIFRDIHRYDELNDDAIGDLYRMLFIARRSPRDLYMDKSETGLNNLIDTVIARLKEGGQITEYNVFQVVLSPNASHQLKAEVESIMQMLQTTISINE